MKGNRQHDKDMNNIQFNNKLKVSIRPVGFLQF